MTDTPNPVGPCAFVIFGATGDLAERLLTPALYHLKRAGLLPDGFSVIGVSRRPESDDAFRDRLGKALRDLTHEDIDAKQWDWLKSRMRYLQGEFDDPATYQRLKTLLDGMTGQTGGNHLYYLATPASQFAIIARQLGQAQLAREEKNHWRRIVIEKPFGTDLPSARALNAELLSTFAEEQIYRIDHYLGKETVQNIMVFRFGNGIFEPVWNRHYIDHVQITVAETLGVEGRGGYYDSTGALRDMVPSHLFQLMTLIAMEPPTCFDAEASRSEKGKVLDAVHQFTRETAGTNAVRAQYGEGVIAGKHYNAYRNEPDVARDSFTETYAALKLGIDNWRWAGVPFYLRTGKALTARKTNIVIRFKPAPLRLFRGTASEGLTPNDMVLHIQPEEGVSLRFGAKIPGPRIHIGDVEMRFNYRDYFKAGPANGYETLLYDCMAGDASLFQRADHIESAWRVVQPVLDLWGEERGTALPVYAAGSAGPIDADELVARDGRRWRALVPNAPIIAAAPDASDAPDAAAKEAAQ